MEIKSAIALLGLIGLIYLGFEFDTVEIGNKTKVIFDPAAGVECALLVKHYNIQFPVEKRYLLASPNLGYSIREKEFANIVKQFCPQPVASAVVAPD